MKNVAREKEEKNRRMPVKGGKRKGKPRGW